MRSIINGWTIFAFILLLISLVGLYYQPNLGMVGIVLSVIIFGIQYYQQHKANEEQRTSFQTLALMVQESSKAQEKLERIKDMIRRKNLSIKMLVSKFDNPIYSIFIYKYNEVPRRAKTKQEKKLVKLLVDDLKFKIIGNSFYMLTPSYMPKTNRSFKIEDWATENIIEKLPKDYSYTLNFVALIDLRQVFSHKTVHYGNTVFDVLATDPKFLSEFLKELTRKDIVSVSDIMKEYDVESLVTIKISSNERRQLTQKSSEIIRTLGCAGITDICTKNLEEIENAVRPYVQDSSAVAKCLYENSKHIRELI